MQIKNFKLTKLELSLIVITMISTWLIGSKNNLVWVFAFLGNFIWLYIGFSKEMAVIIITTTLLLICNLRGFYLWVILGM
ncbi:MAG: hypothetical protein HQ579_07015 [Candidatus Omnitrophica bacterium]|nr:hypothetical protein [Candidatus Omnitrophota bacterium]